MGYSTFRTILWITLLVLAAPFASAQNGEPRVVEGEFIVKLKASAKDSEESKFLGKAQNQKGLQLKNRWRGMSMYHFKANKGANNKQILDDLRADPDVEYAEPNYLYDKANVGEVDEMHTYTASEVQQMASGGSYLSTGAPIQAQEAWGIEAGSSIPIVAIIDTGLDTTHSVFANSGAVWRNQSEIAGNGIDDDGNGYIDDINGWNFVANNGTMLDDEGHGTHVAGIVLGVTQDIYKTPIDAAKIKIMPLKFLDENGSGKTSDAIKAIYYAVQNGATVLNNSWGGPGYSYSLHEAIGYAYEQGVAFVAASGNNASNNDFYPMYPASLNVPNVISIAATTDTDSFAYFSNFGVSTVHMASPGMDILSTYPGGYFVSMRGTSMATPFVAGVAAMMQKERPNILGYQLKQLLVASTDSVGVLSTKTSSSGRLNAYTAVSNVQSASISSTQPSYTVTSAERSLAEAAGGCGTVTKMYREMREGRDGRGPSAPLSNPLYVFVVLLLMAVPIAVYTLLRNKAPEQRRKYDRYKINTDVKVNVNGRELVGSISSISLGGAQINTDALLEQGGVVKMSIASPDGSGSIEVEGRVVWSETNKAYGVQFQDAKEGVLDRISGWTKALSKT